MKTTPPKRVKVYLLENNEWKDMGTGFCIGEIIKKNNTIDNHEDISIDTKDTITNNNINTNTNTNPNTDTTTTNTTDQAFLSVNNEEHPNELLLKSQLIGNIEYQRQEETLIVWKDQEGNDIALSFEESVGCDTLCQFIIQIQKTLSNDISLVAVRASDDGIGSVHEIIAGPVNLPSLATVQDEATLLQSLKILNDNTAYEYLKNQTIQFIISHNYINLLINIFNDAESNHNLRKLILLNNIIKTLVLYNSRDIIELLVNDNNILGVLGTLEYDMEFLTLKANHREFLNNTGPNFKEVVPINNIELKDIIKKCYRLQFLKDVVLVRYLDDANLINDIITDLENCVMSFLQNDPFLDNVIELYDQKNWINLKNTDKLKDGVKLLHQCIQMSKNLDSMDKTNFYKILIKKGLFNVLEYALNIETDSSTRILATDMIITIIEHDILLIQNVQHEKLNVSSSNDNTQQESNIERVKETEDMKLLSILTNILINDQTVGLREQVVQALHTLLHPDGCLNNGDPNDYDSVNILNRYDYLDNDNADDENDIDFDTIHNDDNEMIDYINGHDNTDSSSGNDKNDTRYSNGKINKNKFGNDTVTKEIGKNKSNHSKTSDMNDLQLKRYFNNFYQQIAPQLFDSLINFQIPKGNSKDEIDENLLLHLVKLITFISTEHNRVSSRKFILENQILKNISKLIDLPFNLQLRLTSLRTFKNILALNDKYYHRYMIANNVFDSIFNLLRENILSDNLANSSIRDFCKLITMNTLNFDNTKSNFIILQKYLIDRFHDLLSEYNNIPFIDKFVCNEQLIHDKDFSTDNMDSINDTTLSHGNAKNSYSDEFELKSKRLYSELDSFDA